MKLQRKMVWITLLIVGAALLVGPAAVAQGQGQGQGQGQAQERQVIQNHDPANGNEPSAGPPISFEEFVSSLESESCSGSCNCSVCQCTGTLGCCLEGCDLCFEIACGMA